MRKPFEQDIFRDARIVMAMLQGASRETIMTLCSNWPEFRGGLKRFEEYEAWIKSASLKKYRHSVVVYAQQLWRGDQGDHSRNIAEI